MKSSAVLCAIIAVVSGAASGADPYCGDAVRCVGRIDYDPRLTEFNQRVLEAMHRPYKLEQRGDHVVVWWVPESKAEEAEVDGRVSQYSFALHGCPKEVWPTPETPAHTLKSCKKVAP